ncbi:MAG: hypothetical protein R6U96_11745 [Promethearchaeia archaeon]
MMQRKAHLFVVIFIIHSIILVNLVVINNNNVNAQSDLEEISPEFGNSPVIDGYINRTDEEWNNATKTSMRLYTNSSQTDDGLPIDLWILQNSSDLYICIKFEVNEHDPDEYVGFIISEDETTDSESFRDMKFLQFSDLGGENQDHTYNDSYKEDGDFVNDGKNDGNGAAQLGSDDEEITYEFSIPINNTEAQNDEEDVFLDYGESYAFRIIFGNSDSNPPDYFKSNIISMKIAYPDLPPEPSIWETVLLVLTIIIFSALGALFGYYVYLIYKLEKRIKR